MKVNHLKRQRYFHKLVYGTLTRLLEGRRPEGSKQRMKSTNLFRQKLQGDARCKLEQKLLFALNFPAPISSHLAVKHLKGTLPQLSTAFYSEGTIHVLLQSEARTRRV